MATKKDRTALYSFIVIVLLTVGILAVNQGFVTTEISPTNKYISVPEYGYIACEESTSQEVMFSESPIGQGFAEYSCPSLTGQELLQECTLTLFIPEKDDVDGKDGAVLVKECTEGRPCDDEDASDIYYAKRNYFEGDYAGEEVSIDLNEGEYAIVQYQEGFDVLFRGALPTKDKVDYKVTYRPYLLFRYDSSRLDSHRPIPDTEDCSNFNSQSMLDAGSEVIDSVSGDGETSEVEYLLENKNLQQRGGTIPYISNWAVVNPYLSNKVFFDDGMKYCSQKNLYNVEQIETESGATYLLADTTSNKPYDEVECCDKSDVGPGFYCEDFKKKAIAESEGAECERDADCPIIGYQAVDGGFVNQECIDNKCVTETIEAECSSDSDCPNGRCEVDLENPKNSECVYPTPPDTPGIKCGDGVCEGSETQATCPSDCGEPKPNMTLWIIIGIFVLIILVMIVVYLRQNNTGRRRSLL